MVDPLVVATAVLLGAVGVVSAVLALRYPLSFRIARRYLVRAKVRTVLVVLGLLVATAIVSGSLSVGDTVQAINVHYTYIGIGYTDEGIYGLAPSGGYLYFPQPVATAIVLGASGIPGVAGVSPEIIDRVQIVDHTTSVPQTNLFLIAANSSAAAALGSFTTTTGATLAGPDPGNVLLDERAANDLGAHVGDVVTVYGAHPLTTTVQEIVRDDTRGGVLTAGLSGASVFTDLATAQFLMNGTGQVNFIAVTNVGSLVDGVGLSSSVSERLNATLAATPGTAGLSVHNVLQDALASAQASGAGTETAFLAFGMFSILAGAMLIIGIFSMLAEERKGEMGMLRAIGLPRRAIVLAYYFEGLIYSAGSALVGTFVGLAAGYGLMVMYTTFVPNSVVSQSVIVSSFTSTNASMLASYLVGFLLTLATVTAASVRVSRLNIVRAIRDVPEPSPPLRTYTYLAGAGAALLIVGLLLLAATYRGSGDVSWPAIGGALAILGCGLIASRFVRNRLAFSAVGVALLVWVGAEPVRNAVLGTAHTGGMFVIFVFGVLMVSGALLLVAFNGPSLARGLERLGGGRRGTSPVMRVGLAYPSRRAARTSITLAIFALVIFTIVALATFTATVTGSMSDSIQAQSGGYTFYGTSAQPIPDLPGAIASNPTLAPMFSAVVPLSTGVGHVSVQGFAGNPYSDRIYAAPANGSSASSFYATNQFPFFSTYDGLTASQVMDELVHNASVAVVDFSYSTGSVYGLGIAHPTLSAGATIGVSTPTASATRNLTVIGILKTQILAGVWLNPGTAAALGYSQPNGYLLTVAAGVSVTEAAQQVKSSFFAYGLVVYLFAETLATAVTFTSGEITLLEVFIALGLAVGIAALGILAMRAVTERRHDLGTLRATGLTRGMVLRAFLLEYTFVTVLGAGIGGVLGVLIIYNLVHGPAAAASGITALYIPWLNVIVVLLVTGLLATLAVIGPSLRAASLPPAAAIRGLE